MILTEYDTRFLAEMNISEAPADICSHEDAIHLARLSDALEEAHHNEEADLARGFLIAIAIEAAFVALLWLAVHYATNIDGVTL